MDFMFVPKKIIVMMAMIMAWASGFGQIGIAGAFMGIKRSNVADTFFSKVVADPFRWLENVESEETKDWVKFQKQNWYKFNRKYFPESVGISEKISLYSYTKYKNIIKFPERQGDYYFGTYSDWTLYSRVLLISSAENFSDREIIFHSEDFAGKDHLSIDGYKVSSDSRHLAVACSRNGSDEKEVRIVHIRTKKFWPEVLTKVMYSDIVWLGNGFLYSKHSRDKKFGLINNPEVYFHKLGTEQEKDVLVFRRTVDDPRNFSYKVSEEEDVILLKEESKMKDFFNLFMISIKDDYSRVNVKQILSSIPLSKDLTIVGAKGKKIVAYTYNNAPKGTIVIIDADTPKIWKRVTPAFGNATLTGVLLWDDTTLVCGYRDENMIDALLKVTTEGEVKNFVQVQPGFSINNLVKLNKKQFVFQASFPVVPNLSYKVNIDSFKLNAYDHFDAVFNYSKFEVSLVRYPSDSVEVPILIIKNRESKLDGTNPVILKTYGGYGAHTNFFFSPLFVHFAMEGGIYAYAYVRGGGDQGDDWAKAGKRLNKVNSINDFIAAAEYLIDNKYTSADKIASFGISHGAMVVAAAAIKRPDLFKIVAPVAGSYDVLRQENFSVGGHNTHEYGTVKNEDDFNNMCSYSPYFNIDTTINYPSMLVHCADNDERVTPFQSYKFVARLQANPSQRNPIMLIEEKKSGHRNVGLDNMSLAVIMQTLKAKK